MNMKKISTLIAISLSLVMAAFAQAPVPTSWDFEITAPLGWSSSGTEFYTATSTGYFNTPPACKLNHTGDYVMVNLADEPGNVSYYIRGASFNGGTFKVQESTDGSVWTDLRVITAPNNGAMEQFTDLADPNSRYIRFYYTQKVSGNIALDDISISTPPAGPEEEINVTFDGENVASGGTVAWGAPNGGNTQKTFVIQNLGLNDTLDISDVSFSGTNAGAFNVVSPIAPYGVLAGSDTDLVVQFTPAMAGTHTATMTIANDDANEASYTIHLFGFGDSLATEPNAQATGLVFSNIKSFRAQGSFTSTSADGYLVLYKKGNAITGVPQDGMAYGPGDPVGDAKVVLAGNISDFSPRNVEAGTAYYIAVYSYNGFDDFTNYNQTSPLTGDFTSNNDEAGNYYNNIDVSNTNFVSNLQSLINPHQTTYYGNYDETMVKLFQERDTTNGQKVITCAYTGEEYIYDVPFSWSDYSREHTYPHSWMPTWPADNPEKPEYNDQHHLFPVNFAEANAPRNAFPLGEVETMQSSYLEGKLGLDANGNKVYEPRDAHKGNAARAIFYMCATYNGVSSNAWILPQVISPFIPYGQSQDVLRKWHWQDPPDAWEMSRNDFLDSLQGNRNPFIDHPDYACYINFDNMTYIENPAIPCEVTPPSSVGENKALSMLSVFPNPSNGNFNLAFEVAGVKDAQLEVLDLSGRIVYSQVLQNISGQTQLRINISGVAQGVYLLNLRSEDWSVVEKLIIR